MNIASSLFDLLDCPSGDGVTGEAMRFETVPVPGYAAYLLGKSANGDLALLVDAAGETGALSPLVRLDAVSVFHNALCVVSSGGKASRRRLSVIVLTSTRDALRSSFTQLVTPLITSLGQTPTAKSVTLAFDALVDLFRAAAKPPRRTSQGLWAELYMIVQSQDPAALIRAWHLDPNDRFDFHAGETRLEVKSASGSRTHVVSHAQVSPPEGAVSVIASILTNRAAAGTTIRSLAHRVLSRVLEHPQLQVRVHEVLAASLGATIDSALDEAFDEQMAKATLRYFNAADLPALAAPIPPEITEIHYRLEFSKVAPTPPRALVSLGPLYAASISA